MAATLCSKNCPPRILFLDKESAVSGKSSRWVINTQSPVKLPTDLDLPQSMSSVGTMFSLTSNGPSPRRWVLSTPPTNVRIQYVPKDARLFMTYSSPQAGPNVFNFSLEYKYQGTDSDTGISTFCLIRTNIINSRLEFAQSDMTMELGADIANWAYHRGMVKIRDLMCEACKVVVDKDGGEEDSEEDLEEIREEMARRVRSKFDVPPCPYTSDNVFTGLGINLVLVTPKTETEILQDIEEEVERRTEKAIRLMSEKTIKSQTTKSCDKTDKKVANDEVGKEAGSVEPKQ